MEETNPIESLINKNYKYRAFSKYRDGKTPNFFDFLKLGVSGIFIEPFKLLIIFMPGSFGLFIRIIIYKIYGCSIGTRSIIDNGVIISGCRNIVIGDYVWIDRGVELNADTGHIKIGKRIHIAPYVNIVGLGGVTIGDYSAIGRFAQLLSHSEVSKPGLHMSGPMVPERNKGSKSAAINLGRDVVIGTGAVVMPGVNIGDGAIIGPNSLVLGDIRAWTINIGTPSKVIGIREKFDAD
jgi:acetyltransferase-like isoleucine patch superfamily enzyme